MVCSHKITGENKCEKLKGASQKIGQLALRDNRAVRHAHHIADPAREEDSRAEG